MTGRPLSWAAVPRLLLPLLLVTALVPLRAQAVDDSLHQSIQDLRSFPFRPDCNGNTQEIVACLWHRRNLDDATLGPLLGGSTLLEQWRISRRRVCGRAAAKAEGGSIHPIIWLRCENSLNATLIRQIRQPLVPFAGASPSAGDGGIRP